MSLRRTPLKRGVSVLRSSSKKTLTTTPFYKNPHLATPFMKNQSAPRSMQVVSSPLSQENSLNQLQIDQSAGAGLLHSSLEANLLDYCQKCHRPLAKLDGLAPRRGLESQSSKDETGTRRIGSLEFPYSAPRSLGNHRFITISVPCTTSATEHLSGVELISFPQLSNFLGPPANLRVY